MAGEVTANRAGVAGSFHQLQGLERHRRGRHGDSEVHAGPLGTRRVAEIADLLAAERAGHHRGHGDAGGGLVGGGVGDGVGSSGTGGPVEAHAVYGGAGTVGTLPAASLDVAHHERAQLADSHGSAVLLPRGIGPAVGHGDRGTFGWRGLHRRRLSIGGRRLGCCTGCELPGRRHRIATCHVR